MTSLPPATKAMPPTSVAPAAFSPPRTYSRSPCLGTARPIPACYLATDGPSSHQHQAVAGTSIPMLPVDTPTSLSDIAAWPGPQQRREQRRGRWHACRRWPKKGCPLPPSQPDRHPRLTVKKWTACPPPWAAEEPNPAPAATESTPPPGWSAWEQVRHVRETLRNIAFSSCAVRNA